jgi:hypothetical protein
MTNKIKDVFSSFRDPVGSVLVVAGRVFRFIQQPYESVMLDFLNSNFFQENCSIGNFPDTQVVNFPPGYLKHEMSKRCVSLVLEHQSIPFPTYPHEWTPTMLFDAGQFTIDLAEQSLANDLLLKDATPWNILFSEGKPVFCDMLSFEGWSGTAIWNAYAQFQRTFILPLYAHNQHAWPVHLIFIDKRDGLDPSMLANAIKGWRRMAFFELQTIIIPAKLSRGSVIKDCIDVKNSNFNSNIPSRKLANYVLHRTFSRLRKQLDVVRPYVKKNTQWSNYENNLQHYSNEEHYTKSNFVLKSLLHSGKGRVLDIGANAGEYSLMAASQGNPVVAADFDVAALDKLYMRVKAEGLSITPVVFNFARPTPAVGWNNNEVDSFLARAKGQFNVLMVLAILHHLIVTERIPLGHIINLLYELNAKFLIIEWVNPDDQRFRWISRTHTGLYENLSDDTFQSALEHKFSILDRLQLGSGSRVLYLCERR